MTVAEYLKNRHDSVETYRAEHGFNPPGWGGGWWRCPPNYQARPWEPLWVADDGDTVVRYATGWTWGQAHRRSDWRDPVELIETCFLVHTPEQFATNEVDVQRPRMWNLHGGFVEYSAGFDLWTADEELYARLVVAAARSVPFKLAYSSRVGNDAALHQSFFETRDEAYQFLVRLGGTSELPDAHVFQHLTGAQRADLAVRL